MLKIANDQNFDQIKKSKNVIVVDFWAKWCGPCRMMGPIMEEVASRWYGNGVGVYKMDIDEAPTTTASFGIRSVPTILILEGGEVVDQIVGTLPAKELSDRIQRVVMNEEKAI